MSKIIWPPKKCCRYAFWDEKELDFKIAYEEDKNIEKDATQDEINNR